MSKPKDEAAANQLLIALKRTTEGTRLDRCAQTAYMQAVLAQAAGQGLINLLKQKNLINDREIENALAAAYDERFKQLAGTHSIVTPTAPLVRPS